jgi:N-acetylglucosaminyldiphosphoundecaprenol N-acetyl-beta-D-mannosaminyltransferase
LIDRGKREVIGVKIDVVDYEAAVSRIIHAARLRMPYSVSALAVHGVVTAARDSGLRDRVNRMDLVVPDGQPIRWALNQLHGAKLADRVYGPNLTINVLEACAQEGLAVYFYGSTSTVLKSLVARLSQRIPSLKVAGSEPSKFREIGRDELAATAERIEASGARVCFVGLGCPRQELFTAAIQQSLPMPALAVGAAFDFHAGSLPQAPKWMQDRGFEWAYRLRQEPRRLWRRYAQTNTYFLGAWALQALGYRRRIPPTESARATVVPG